MGKGISIMNILDYIRVRRINEILKLFSILNFIVTYELQDLGMFLKCLIAIILFTELLVLIYEISEYIKYKKSIQYLKTYGIEKILKKMIDFSITRREFRRVIEEKINISIFDTENGIEYKGKIILYDRVDKYNSNQIKKELETGGIRVLVDKYNSKNYHVMLEELADRFSVNHKRKILPKNDLKGVILALLFIASNIMLLI